MCPVPSSRGHWAGSAPGPAASGGNHGRRAGNAGQAGRDGGPASPRRCAPAVGAGHRAAHPAAGLVRADLPGRAGRAPGHGVLADQPVHHEHRADLEPGQPARGGGATSPAYRDIILRTVGMAAAVTVTDAVVAFPFACFMARIASGRTRTFLFMAILLPLWASYLAKVYSWLLIFTHNGILDWTLGHASLGQVHLIYTNWAVYIVFCYLWLPFMVIPVYAALERIPASQIEASQDLGGRTWRTTRMVLFPLALPGIVAGSIFTFSLTLGDYITPLLVGGTSATFIGNIIYTTSASRTTCRSPPRWPCSRSPSWPSTCSAPGRSARSRRSDRHGTDRACASRCGSGWGWCWRSCSCRSRSSCCTRSTPRTSRAGRSRASRCTGLPSPGMTRRCAARFCCRCGSG